ncbi:hypothetical protein [Streptomyces sp. NPDC048341]
MLEAENNLSTRSFIARPTVGTGYSGIHAWAYGRSLRAVPRGGEDQVHG